VFPAALEHFASPLLGLQKHPFVKPIKYKPVEPLFVSEISRE